MKCSPKEDSSGSNRIISRLAADKKKTVLALCLVGVMVFMWIKVLNKKKPETVQATSAQANSSDASKTDTKVLFVELPFVPGRNDILARDFFDARARWGLEGGSQVNVFSQGPGHELAARISDLLRLEAITLGDHPEAFINGRLVSVGDELVVGDGSFSYECKIERIEKNLVLIDCGGTQIQLKIGQAHEVVD